MNGGSAWRGGGERFGAVTSCLHQQEDELLEGEEQAPPPLSAVCGVEGEEEAAAAAEGEREMEEEGRFDRFPHARIFNGTVQSNIL